MGRWWRSGVVTLGAGLTTSMPSTRSCRRTPPPSRVASSLGSWEIGWIADLGDPWALDEMTVYPTGLHRRMEIAYMRRELRTAAAVVMSTPEAARQVVRHLPRALRPPGRRRSATATTPPTSPTTPSPPATRTNSASSTPATSTPSSAYSNTGTSTSATPRRHRPRRRHPHPLPRLPPRSRQPTPRKRPHPPRPPRSPPRRRPLRNRPHHRRPRPRHRPPRLPLPRRLHRTHALRRPPLPPHAKPPARPPLDHRPRQNLRIPRLRPPHPRRRPTRRRPRHPRAVGTALVCARPTTRAAIAEAIRARLEREGPARRSVAQRDRRFGYAGSPRRGAVIARNRRPSCPRRAMRRRPPRHAARPRAHASRPDSPTTSRPTGGQVRSAHRSSSATYPESTTSRS